MMVFFVVWREDGATKPDEVITAKGLVYKFLDNWKTQKYKKVEDKIYDEQQILVFIPDYDFLTENVGGKKVYVVDSDMKKLRTNIDF